MTTITEDKEGLNKKYADKDYYFSFGRRTGRIRYITLKLFVSSILLLLIFGIESLKGVFPSADFINYIFIIPVLWLVLITIQRHMDVGGNLASFLIVFIPLLNLAYIFTLFFGKGATYRNEHGPIPIEKISVSSTICALGILLHCLNYFLWLM